MYLVVDKTIACVHLAASFLIWASKRILAFKSGATDGVADVPVHTSRQIFLP